MSSGRRLMQLWQQFRALDGSARWLIIEAVTLMVIIQAGFRTLSYAMLRRGLDNVKALRAGSRHSPSRIGWAVNAVGRRLPGRTCLSEALAADVMLCRHGYSPIVRLGIRKTDGRSARPEAHAWVECGGKIVTGELSMLDDYKLLH
jgi:hypothetical protein